MQGKHLYEYAVIRVVPRVEREEFINVGVILFSKQAKFIKMIYQVDENKLKLFHDELDLKCIYDALESYRKICNGEKEGGRIASFEIAERFRWITAIKSSCIQTSRPHPGFSENLNQTAEELFKEMVL